MKHIPLMLASFAFVLVGSLAQADDREVVEAFYTQLLSAPNAPDIADRVADVVVEDWVSIPTPRGGPDAEGLVKSLQGFGAAIPDLNWEIQEILQDGNR
ncbi:MAG: nuclear transport factor 2 family protein, partial [Pseudomonadota bacterium]